MDIQKEPYSDPEARWGVRTNADAEDGIEHFYGYKLHLICDAIHGVPLAYEVLPANRNDSPTLPGLVNQVMAKRPGLKPRYLMADKGYDALSNYQRLNDLRINRVGMTQYCDIEYCETLESDALRKVGRLVRTTSRWKRLYKRRASVERAFRSLKRSRLLNQRQFRGLAKLRLHSSLALLTYCATMLARVRAGEFDIFGRSCIQ